MEGSCSCSVDQKSCEFSRWLPSLPPLPMASSFSHFRPHSYRRGQGQTRNPTTCQEPGKKVQRWWSQFGPREGRRATGLGVTGDLRKTLPFYQSSWAVKCSRDIICITTWHQQWSSGKHGQAVEKAVGEGASSSWSLALFAPTPSKHLPAQTSWLGCRVGAWETAHFLKPPEVGSYQLPVRSDHTEATYRQLGFKKLFSSEI